MCSQEISGGTTTEENSAINQIDPANNVVMLDDMAASDSCMQISPETSPNNDALQVFNVNRFCYNYFVRQST